MTKKVLRRRQRHARYLRPRRKRLPKRVVIEHTSELVSHGDAGLLEVVSQAVGSFLVGALPGKDAGANPPGGAVVRAVEAMRLDLPSELRADGDNAFAAVLVGGGREDEARAASGAVIAIVTPAEAPRGTVAEAGIKQDEVGQPVIVGDGEEARGLLKGEGATDSDLTAARLRVLHGEEGIAVEPLGLEEPRVEGAEADTVFLQHLCRDRRRDLGAPFGEGGGVRVADAQPAAFLRDPEHAAGRVGDVAADAATGAQIEGVFFNDGGERRIHRLPHGGERGEAFFRALQIDHELMQPGPRHRFVGGVERDFQPSRHAVDLVAPPVKAGGFATATRGRPEDELNHGGGSGEGFAGDEHAATREDFAQVRENGRVDFNAVAKVKAVGKDRLPLSRKELH